MEAEVGNSIGFQFDYLKAQIDYLEIAMLGSNIAIFAHMEQAIFELLTKAGINPTTAILAVILWLVKKQQTTLENLVTAFSNRERETNNTLEEISANIRKIGEGGGSLNRDQAIKVFWQFVDLHVMRVRVIAEDTFGEAKKLPYAQIRESVVDKMLDEHRRMCANFRAFEFRNRQMTDFAKSTSRRWQYMMDEVVNKIYLSATGDKSVDTDFEAYYDRFRSKLQGSFATWLDTGTDDTETFEQEFAQKSKMQDIEWVRETNGN